MIGPPGLGGGRREGPRGRGPARRLYIYIYMYMYLYIHDNNKHVDPYIYIYRERERDLHNVESNINYVLLTPCFKHILTLLYTNNNMCITRTFVIHCLSTCLYMITLTILCLLNCLYQARYCVLC